jgi:hypothetical protein
MDPTTDSTEQVHVWPQIDTGIWPPEPYVRCGDTVHIARHEVHGIEVCRRAEEDIEVTGVVPTGDAVLICGRCPDGACRAVVYSMDACVTRIGHAA